VAIFYFLTKMKRFGIFVIALLCSSALAFSPVDTCMFTQVSRMSTEGQKLAFKLTRTEVNTKLSESVEVVEQEPVIKTITVNEAINLQADHESQHGVWETTTQDSEKWVTEHESWNVACQRWK
jgi:hypothetical protein